MTPSMIICLLVFVFMIISFSLNKIPMSLTSIICLVVLVLTGCIDAKTALGIFGSTTVITMASMFVIAAGLNRTQMIHHISRIVYKVSKGSFTGVLASYVLATFILAQFIPSTVAIFALVCPLVMNMCEEMGISPSKVMFSIALTVIATCFTIVPIGPYASNFIADNGYLQSYGFAGGEFSIWSETLVKIPVTIFVLLWAIFVAPKLAPDTPDIPIEMLEGRQLTKKEPLSPVREVIGYSVFIVVILGLMLQSYIGISSWVIALSGAIVIVASGVLSEREAIANMNMDIILLYVGVVVLGNALANTGTGDVIGSFFASTLNNTTNSYIIAAAFFAFSFVLTTVLYDRAVPPIVLPITILTSLSLGADPRGLILIGYIGTMSAIITPMATAVVPMMMGAGGYNQKSLLKMGILPALLMGVVAVISSMFFFPAFQ